MAILKVLVVIAFLLAVIAVGAVKLWPVARNWTEAPVSGKSRTGPDREVLSAMTGNAGFEQILKSVAVVPELRPLVQNGSYLKVLEEAVRQNVQNLVDLKAAKIASTEVRAAW